MHKIIRTSQKRGFSFQFGCFVFIKLETFQISNLSVVFLFATAYKQMHAWKLKLRALLFIKTTFVFNISIFGQ